MVVGKLVHEFGSGVVLSLLVQGTQGDYQEEGQGQAESAAEACHVAGGVHFSSVDGCDV